MVSASSRAPVAIITGGNGVVGTAVATALADDGWTIAVCYRSASLAATGTRDAVRRAGCGSFAIKCDLSRPGECERFLTAVTSTLGEVTALVNCAGGFRQRPLLEEDLDGWHSMFDDNLHQVYYMCRLVGPHLAERRRGRIVNFAMATADRIVASPQSTAYHIAKAGVLVLTKTFAQLLGPYGVTTNAVSPGVIASDAEPDAATASLIPAGRLAGTADIVSAVRFLLSNDASYINGANIHVTGGWGL